MIAMDERTALRSRTRPALWRPAGFGWMFLLTGIAWLIASVLILRIATASVATVGVLMGVLFLVAMLDEFFIAAVSPSWRWAHIVMGVLLAIGAGWALARPYNAFWALASVPGLLLILRGTFDIITAVVTKDINSAWCWGWWPASWTSSSASGPPSSSGRYAGRCCWSGSGCSPCSAASPRS
jgi:uncharacterized membrane protein HdeD (DUF308 family)